MELTQFKVETSNKITLRLRVRDKDLLTQKAFSITKDDYVSRLRRESDSSYLVGRYTLDELKHMLGYIALAASSTKGLKDQKELESLYEYVSRILAHYDHSLC